MIDMTNKTVYLSGGITGVDGYREAFAKAEDVARSAGARVVINPASLAVYAHDSSTIAHDVRKWCIDNGQNKLLRIALCGHNGEHNELESLGWKVETWDKCGGYQGADDRERIWFSPSCLFPSTERNLFNWLSESNP